MKLNIYWYEIKILMIYNIICFFSVLVISFWKVLSLYAFFSYPIMKLIKTKLIILKIFDFLNSSWNLILTTSLFFELIFFIFSFFFFSFNGWYFFQIFCFKKIINKIVISFFLFLFFYFFFFISFFLFEIIFFWEFLNSKYTIYHFFHLQLQVTFLINDLFLIYFNFLFITTITTISFFYFKLIINFVKSYFTIKINKFFVFIIIFVFQLLLFFNSNYQLINLCSTFFFSEIVFFLFCYKFSEYIIFKNGNV